MDKLYVKVEVAAEMVSIGRTAMYQLLKEQKVRSTRLGTARLVDVDSLKTYMSSLSYDGDEAVTTKENNHAIRL